MNARARKRRVKQKILLHKFQHHDDENGEGFADIFSSAAKSFSSFAKSAAPAISAAAKTVGNVAKAAAPHVATAVKYVGKHADDWAPPIINGVSQLVSAKMREKASSINQKAEDMLKEREAERKTFKHDEELSAEEINNLLNELAKGRGLEPHKTGFISGKKAEGLYLPGTSGNAPVNSSTFQGLMQTVGGNGLHVQPCYADTGIIKLH